MKNLILLLCIVAVGFLSCEGRTSKNEALRNSVVTFKKKNPVNQIDYIPEAYAERVTDSILSTGINVSIKESVDMENAVVKSIDAKDTTKKQYYRHLSTKVTVRNNNNIVVFDSTIDKEFLAISDTAIYTILKQSVCRGLWLEQSKSNNRETYLITSYYDPIEDKTFDYNIIIDTQTGTYKSIPLNYART